MWPNLFRQSNPTCKDADYLRHFQIFNYISNKSDNHGNIQDFRQIRKAGRNSFINNLRVSRSIVFHSGRHTLQDCLSSCISYIGIVMDVSMEDIHCPAFLNFGRPCGELRQPHPSDGGLCGNTHHADMVFSRKIPYQGRA